MTNSNSNCLPNWYLVHTALAIVIGFPIWLAPGHVLTSVGWIPELVQLPESALSVPGTTFINPIFVRVMGAVLVAIGLGTIFVWRSGGYAEVRMWAKLNLIFCFLAALGILREALRPYEYFTTVAWIGFAILVFFGLAWGKLLLSVKKGKCGGSTKEIDLGGEGESVLVSGNYSKNVEETVSQIRRLTKQIPDENLQTRLLEEVAALDAIIEIARLAQGAEDSETEE